MGHILAKIQWIIHDNGVYAKAACANKNDTNLIPY